MTRQEASRINGAKSKGPITEEGKKRSSRNALKHNLCSPFILLPQEGKEHFQGLAEMYFNTLNPQDELQLELVNEIACCTWRQLRLLGIESSLLEASSILTTTCALRSPSKASPTTATRSHC